jgi:hypothetical protein
MSPTTPLIKGSVREGLVCTWKKTHTHYSLEEQQRKCLSRTGIPKWRLYFARGHSQFENPETGQSTIRSEMGKGMIGTYNIKQERY